MKNDKTKLTALMGIIMLIAALFLPFLGLRSGWGVDDSNSLVGLLGKGTSFFGVIFILLTILSPVYLILEAFKDKVPAKVFVIPVGIASLIPLALLLLFGLIMPKSGLESVAIELRWGYFVYLIAAIIAAIAYAPRTDKGKSMTIAIGAVVLLIVAISMIFIATESGGKTMLTVFGAKSRWSESTFLTALKIVSFVELIVTILLGLSSVRTLDALASVRKYLPSPKVMSIVLLVVVVLSSLTVFVLDKADDHNRVFMSGSAQTVYLIISIAILFVAFRKNEENLNQSTNNIITSKS